MDPFAPKPLKNIEAVRSKVGSGITKINLAAPQVALDYLRIGIDALTVIDRDWVGFELMQNAPDQTKKLVLKEDLLEVCKRLESEAATFLNEVQRIRGLAEKIDAIK